MKKLKYVYLILLLLTILVLPAFYLTKNTKKQNIVAIELNNGITFAFDSSQGELVGLNDFSKETQTGGILYYTTKNNLNLSSDIYESHKGDKYILYFSKSYRCEEYIPDGRQDGAIIDLLSETPVTKRLENYGGTTAIYYACYEQTNLGDEGYRQVASNAYFSGDKVQCGDEVHVTKCFKKKVDGELVNLCEFDEINGESALGTVYRGKLESKGNVKCETPITPSAPEEKKYTFGFDSGYGTLIGLDDFSKKEQTGGSTLYYTTKNNPILSTDIYESHKGDKYILYFSKSSDCKKYIPDGRQDGAIIDLLSEEPATKKLLNGAETTIYYACYEQTNLGDEGYRQVASNAYFSGDKVQCGDEVHVTNCFKKKVGGELVNLCEFDEINGESALGTVYRGKLESKGNVKCEDKYTIYFHEDSEGQEGDGLECGKTEFSASGICKASGNVGTEVPTPDVTKLKSGDKKFIGWAADDDGKNVNCSGQLITNTLKITENQKYYACYEKETQKCSNTLDMPNKKGEHDITVCYTATKDTTGNISIRPIEKEYNQILTCANGYTLDKVSTTNVIADSCNKEGVCSKTYRLNCIGERPKISATSVMVGSNNRGQITFTATSDAGIKGWYSSNYYTKPTKNTFDWNYETSGNYSVISEPGSVFLWAIDNNDQISYTAMASVIDKINADTTIGDFKIKDSDGNNLNTEKYAFNEDKTSEIVPSDYVRLSNKLDSKVLANLFNPFSTAYKVTTKSDKITVFATLTSKDSGFIDGYEPRTVDLDYGINTILIKIQNKKGNTRTYTIIVTREDDRDSNNYLKSLTVSEGRIAFDQYRNDYVVTVAKNKKSVSINGELASTNSSYVKGYEPRKIELKNESTTAVIKVKSETGSIRAYTITFIKNGTESKDDKNSYLASLSLNKTYIAFDKDVNDYNTSVDYEIDEIIIYALAQNGGDSVNFYKTINGKTEKINSNNIPLELGNNLITIIVTNKDAKSRTYNVNILRKENGLTISDNTDLSMLSVSGYDIKFNAQKLDYVLKIKREKTLLIAATPANNRSEIYIRGNDNLSGFSIVRIKVVSEDGQFKEYTIDIKKDAFNQKIELIALFSGVVIIIGGIIIIRVKKKRKSINDYYA